MNERALGLPKLSPRASNHRPVQDFPKTTIPTRTQHNTQASRLFNKKTYVQESTAMLMGNVIFQGKNI